MSEIIFYKCNAAAFIVYIGTENQGELNCLEVKCKPEVANTTGQVEDGLAGQVPLVHIERHLVLPVAGPVLELDQHVLREPTANTTNTSQLQ